MVDESATGSANLWSRVDPSGDRVRAMPHVPRPPSVDHGVISFLWALVFGVFLWLGMAAVGVSSATAFIVAAVAAFVIFLYVRVYGEDTPRRQAASPRDRVR